MANTNFNNVVADSVTATFVGNVTGNVTGTCSLLQGALMAKSEISKSDNYALSAAEIAYPVVILKNTGSGKVFTLGLAAGQAMIVYNSGSETFTLKNVAGDTGTSTATTKALLIIGSATANASIVIALN